MKSLISMKIVMCECGHGERVAVNTLNKKGKATRELGTVGRKCEKCGDLEISEHLIDVLQEEHRCL